MKKYKIVNKKKFYRSIVIISLVIIGIFFLVLGRGRADAKITYKTKIIQPGETLWSIAEAENTDMDIRQYIYNIRKINNLKDANIRPGQELLIPIKDKL